MPRQAKVPSPRFNLKDSSVPERDTLIYLVFRYQNIRIKYSTGEKIKPKYWDGSRAKYTRKHPEYVDLNSRLNKIEETAIQIFRDYNLGNISKEEFKHQLDIRLGKTKPTEDENPSFFQFVDRYIESLKSKPNAKRGTWKKFETVANHLKNFAEEKRVPLDWESFDWQFKHEFEGWLFSPPRNHAINNASKIFQVLKQFLYEAERRGLHQNITFKQKGFGIKRVQVKKIALSFEELKQLADLDLADNLRLDRVRDLFLIGAYSGLRYSDFTRIKPEHIINDGGVEIIELFTLKTDTEVAIPLMPELKAILKKNDYRSPKAISSQKMNDYLKELCQQAGINERIVQKYSEGGLIKEREVEKWELISTHTARRSFATNFHELGIPASFLMQITGHASEKQFLAYVNTSKRRNAKNIAARISETLLRNNHI